MTTLIIIGAVVFIALAILMWHCLGDPVESHEEVKRQLALSQARELIRNDRMKELREAYKLAKEELGEEPTVAQIFLTRDQLRTQKALNDGTS